jgi:2-octaprenyl-6-methoxyphenol hydroxylase
MGEAMAVSDVVIAGAGIPGLALACALADALGPEAAISLVERGAAPRRDIRAVALSAASVRLLGVLGAWSQIAEDAEPVTRVEITDSRLEDALRPVLVSYDNTVDGGPATYIVGQDRIWQALGAAARRRPQVRLLPGRSVEGFHAGAHVVEVRLADGAVLAATLLVAADGQRSPLRSAAGIKSVHWRYPQLGIVTIVGHEGAHGGRAVQHFLPSGPFAILPLKGNRSCITWTEEEDGARRILALEEGRFRDEVERRLDYRLGGVMHIGPRGGFPLDMHLARALIAARFALIGDAAHTVHPIAGQGLNLALRDVAALAEIIADAARLGLDFGTATVLEGYQRWRRLDAALSAAAFDGLNLLFSNDATLLRTARGVGLGLLERMPVIKQLLVAEAAGLTGDVPRLLRGEPP